MWNLTIDCSIRMLDLILKHSTIVIKANPNHKNFDCKNYTFSSDKFRRAHLSIIDARATHKLWISHLTIFPAINDSSPIFGFDTVCGPTRVSGAFHDFSPGGGANHYMMQHFEESTKDLIWRKPRKLPEWATKIFSGAMIAAGAIIDESEVKQFCSEGEKNLKYYLDNVGRTVGDDYDFSREQNFYCENQRKNPHTSRTMKLLGMSDYEADVFLNEELFPLV